MVSYLAWRLYGERLQRAYNRPVYTEALGALKALHRELPQPAVAEGLDDLDAARLGLYGVLGRSLKTSVESVNALVEERCAKVDHWQKRGHRWLATALWTSNRACAR